MVYKQEIEGYVQNLVQKNVDKDMLTQVLQLAA